MIKTIKVELKSKKEGSFIRKAELVKHTAVVSTKVLLTDPNVHALAVGVGLQQGLKYKGSFKSGVKAGLATYGATIVGWSIYNVANNIDVIKEA